MVVHVARDAEAVGSIFVLVLQLRALAIAVLILLLSLLASVAFLFKAFYTCDFDSLRMITHEESARGEKIETRKWQLTFRLKKPIFPSPSSRVHSQVKRSTE